MTWLTIYHSEKKKTNMEKQIYEFKAVESLSLGNSYGTIKEEGNIQLSVSVGINHSEYGWFEVYDDKTGGEDWYAEGGLWFKNKELVDYDGVFALPTCVLDKLEEIGINVTNMR